MCESGVMVALLVVGLLLTQSPDVALSSEDGHVSIQFEKLRMTALTLREVSRSERRLLGAVLISGGLAFTGAGAVSLSQDLSEGATNYNNTFALSATGLSMIGVGTFILLSKNDSGLWDDIDLLKQKGGLAEPQILLAEAEAIFEKEVQDSVRGRKWTGGAFMAGALLELGLSLINQRNGPFDTHAFLTGVMPSVGAAFFAVFEWFFYRAPVERAWAVYVNDKNIQRSFVSIAPTVSLGLLSGSLGVAGTF